jgi:hypothetical protein
VHDHDQAGETASPNSGEFVPCKPDVVPKPGLRMPVVDVDS